MMIEDKKFLHPRGIAALISLLSLLVIGFVIIAGINFLSIKPVYAQTPTAPVITQTGVTTSYEPWAIWVRGTNLTSTIKTQLFDTDGTRWGGDIPTALSGDSTWVSFILPADFPPSGCNRSVSCNITVKLLDTNTNLLSNSYAINLPIADKNPVINNVTTYFTGVPWEILVWDGASLSANGNYKAQLFDVDGTTRWGGDLPTVYGVAPPYTYVSVTLPGTSPPSGCNYYFGTCAVFVRLLDTNTGLLSNTFSFTLPLITGATPTPTVTPGGPTPTPSSCSLKSSGDANCDGKVDLVDYEIWRREFIGEESAKNADFSGDGTVNLVDFEIWRRSFTETGPSPTIVPSNTPIPVTITGSPPSTPTPTTSGPTLPPTLIPSATPSPVPPSPTRTPVCHQECTPSEYYYKTCYCGTYRSDTIPCGSNECQPDPVSGGECHTSDCFRGQNCRTVCN